MLHYEIVLSTFVGCLGGLALLSSYIFFEEKMKAKKATTAANATEGKVTQYGIQEVPIRITYPTLNEAQEDFLRHIDALSDYETLEELLEITENLNQFLESVDHPNSVDVQDVLDIFQHAKEYTKETLYMAEKWLKVAQTYWTLHPCEEMFPFVFDVAATPTKASPSPL